MHYFQNIFYFARYTKCQGFIQAQKYSCQICIILATGCQNLGRLNRRLSEVLVYILHDSYIFVYLFANLLVALL